MPRKLKAREDMRVRVLSNGKHGQVHAVDVAPDYRPERYERITRIGLERGEPLVCVQYLWSKAGSPKHADGPFRYIIAPGDNFHEIARKKRLYA